MNYFGQWSNLQLVRQDGSTRLAADVLRHVPYVVLFFGASWHAETEAFMDVMGRFYEANHDAHGFEVVYISRDYSKAEMMQSFLLSERAATAARLRERQERKEERRLRRQQSDADAATGTGESAAQSEAGCTSNNSSGDRSGRRDSATAAGTAGGDGEHPRRKSLVKPRTAPSTPPPLKRVAELRPNSPPTSGLASASAHPLSTRRACGFWAVPYDHVGCVGVPLLYHLRVFSYPGVVVCRNKPFSLRTKPVLLPALAEQLPPSSLEAAAPGPDPSPSLPPAAPRGEEDGAPATEGEAAAEDSELLPPGMPAARVVDCANAPQRRKFTPVVARRDFQPEVITIAGRFMMEQDPCAENFPWDKMPTKTQWAALMFFVIVSVVTVVALTWLLPTILISRHTAAILKAQRQR